ncbi:hypothetical protein SK3146_05686 [Paenibacillus konkukensis]|uniref:Cache domain-containing protein n=1 Tax=Paenibacillus konkukensis TaxID=2020716 RepID=A0ABY4RWM1_9BACL|nr:cache domain-containing protein [Paenibacillus konkukensis]UQZ86393.1 hypothetical protein SK3146_05686 [Paenibacillus konkukensis]
MTSLLKRVRIDRLFFGSFAVFIAALLLIFTWISYSITSRELADNTSYYQQDLLGELNKQLDIQRQSIEQMSLAAARNIDTVGYDPLEKDSFERLRRKKDLLNMLANITYSTTMVQSIYLYMENPELTDSQAPVKFLDIRDVQSQSWYPDVKSNDFAWIGDHMLDTNTGPQHFIGFARKVYNNSGKYYGLLVLNVKASAIEQLVRGETEQRNRILLDAGGKTISAIGGLTLGDSELSRIRASEKKSGSFRLPAASACRRHRPGATRCSSGANRIRTGFWPKRRRGAASFTAACVSLMRSSPQAYPPFSSLRSSRCFCPGNLRSRSGSCWRL